MTDPSRSHPFTTRHDGKKEHAPKKHGTVGELYGATYTIGTEANDTANVITVTIQLTDYFGEDMAKTSTVFGYLSDDALGTSIGTAHSTSPAIESDGELIVVVATDVAWWITSEIDGDISIDFEDDGTQTVYLVLVMPDGRLQISDAITHAA